MIFQKSLQYADLLLFLETVLQLNMFLEPCYFFSIL